MYGNLIQLWCIVIESYYKNFLNFPLNLINVILRKINKGNVQVIMTLILVSLVNG